MQLNQDVADFGADTQFLRVEGRGSYYYPFYPDWVLNVAGRAGYILAWARTSACSIASSWAVRRSAASSSPASGPATPPPATPSAASYCTPARRATLPLGLPEELRIFGRGFVEAGSLVDPDVSGPTVFDSSAPGLGRRRPVLAVAAGPDRIDLAHAFLKEDEDETELFRISFGTRF